MRDAYCSSVNPSSSITFSTISSIVPESPISLTARNVGHNSSLGIQRGPSMNVRMCSFASS
jgi:hypothetical protein